MGLLGSFAYQTSSALLQEISLRQLDALAESKSRNLLKVNEGWKNQVRLIREGTGLPTLIQSYRGDKGLTTAELSSVVERSIEDVEALVQIKIVENGQVTSNFGADHQYPKVVLPALKDEIKYSGSFFNTRGMLFVVYTALLPSGSTGHIEVVFDTRDVESVTGNYTGLGETGEVMLVQLAEDEAVTVLNSRRFKDEPKNEIISFPLDVASDAVQKVLAGESGIFEDYRGKTVWAATRYLSDLEWGLVVKIDSKEESRRADFLLDSLVDIALALSAFAIIGGTLLGFYLARPIHQLAVLVERVRHGEEGLRADVKGDDEIAYLAESLNELMDHYDPVNQKNKDEKTDSKQAEDTPRDDPK
ncbi:MAG: hypothetical protein ACI9FB_001328 [Candidatus Azotimanducaceae bacterium]|jgi:hypothetical protein